MAPRTQSSVVKPKTTSSTSAVLSDTAQKKMTRVSSAQKTQKKTMVPKKTTATIILKKSREPKNNTIVIADNRVSTPRTTSPQKSITSLKESQSKKSEEIIPTLKKSVKEKCTVPIQTISRVVLPKLSILSPFRFPLVVPRSPLSIIALSFGAVFILTGTLLSTLNLPYREDLTHVFSNDNNTASLAHVSVSENTTSQTYTLPDPHIFVSDNATLSGTVPLKVTVPNARGVHAMLYMKETETLLPLGALSRIDENTWTYPWNTTQYSDGEYHIHTVITTSETSYSFQDTNTYHIQNNLETVNNELSLSGNSTTEISSSSVQIDERAITTTSTAPRVTAETNPSDNTVLFRIFVKNASKAGIHARSVDTGVLHFLGKATSYREDEWHLTWDTMSIPDGLYKMYPSAMVDGKTIEGSRIEILIANRQETLDAFNKTSSTSPTQLEPTIDIHTLTPSPLSKFATIQITTSPVSWVELYAVPKNTLIPRFLGLATKKSENDWVLHWDTTQSPNGEYLIYARVKTEYGFTEGKRHAVKILNDIIPTFTETQEEQINTIQKTTEELLKETNTPISGTEQGSSTVPKNLIYIEPIRVFVDTLEVDDDLRLVIFELLKEYRVQLDVLIGTLALAMRNNDESTLTETRLAIETLQNTFSRSLREKVGNKDVLDKIQTHISQTGVSLQEIVTLNETLIKERVAEAVTKDSDKDRVSDFDEIRLYKTNPFSADTDGDGYVDSLEIESGYNPLDSTEQAMLTYQSPKETGIIRDDLLKVDSVTTLSTTTSHEQPKALFSGKGLPNSFVTLYIFSTPIIVTVRTDSDGNWSYIFDKELENGNHEVYVGIIDNTGNVIVKSSVFPFVKTAQAFTRADSVSSALQAQESEQSFLTDKHILFTASFLIVSFGIVLVGLGVHERARKKLEPLTQTI